MEIKFIADLLYDFTLNDFVLFIYLSTVYLPGHHCIVNHFYVLTTRAFFPPTYDIVAKAVIEKTKFEVMEKLLMFELFKFFKLKNFLISNKNLKTPSLTTLEFNATLNKNKKKYLNKITRSKVVRTFILLNNNSKKLLTNR